ncbi:hypothetical protein RRG08_008542 [Elysia crispata]|uniref:Uncharacterized protein n=1 Tax=Elysia crispata TaxID=231223 RepID=A0AAE1CXL2_9GAST|nr:hypothetical protein RRG08_008542 [Elysia crispata]
MPAGGGNASQTHYTRSPGLLDAQYTLAGTDLSNATRLTLLCTHFAASVEFVSPADKAYRTPVTWVVLSRATGREWSGLCVFGGNKKKNPVLCG